MELSGRRVLVTGASRGIGEATAEAFAAAGARVALVARDEVALKELAGRLGGTAHAADLTDPSQVEGLIGRIEADGGPIDVLVNNAGIDLTGAFVDHTAGDLERIYRLNLLTPAELIRQAVPGMVARGGGQVVNVSSMAGASAFPGMAAYASTKAGLTMLTSILRLDLKGLPVRATVVEIGPIPTDMLDHVNDYAPTAHSFRRFYRLQLLVDIDRSVVAAAIVDAVRKDKRHVRLPKRAVLFPMLANAPRRMVELMLVGVKHRPAGR
jgi:uncharacterized protein